jgi:aminopeptidase YwaD
MTTAAMEHLEYLSAQVGPRPLGSPANLAAGEYVARVLAALGLAVEEQALPCPLWEADARLELTGEPLPALANTWSPSCDVTAPAAAVGTVIELEEAALEGHIAVLYGELTKDHGHGARSAFYYPEESRKVIRLLEQKRPAAVLTVSPTLGCPERLIRDWEFPLPSATVLPEAGMRLLQSAGQPLHLRISAQRSPGRFVNVVARKAGRRPERLILLAHFDTQADTPGAADNAGGVAVLLALAARFAAVDLEYGLEWLAVNGEEVGGVGDAVYLQRQGDTLDQVLVAINIDGAGQVLSPISLTVMGGSPALQEAVWAVKAQHTRVLRVEPWYASDHTAFLFHGVPCLVFSSVGLSNIHMPFDTVAWISPARLQEAVELAADIVAALGDRPAAWFRE